MIISVYAGIYTHHLIARTNDYLTPTKEHFTLAAFAAAVAALPCPSAASLPALRKQQKVS